LYSFRIRKSPYFNATERHGCKSYTIYNNMYLPLVYEDLVSDYWHLKNGVTIWDVGCERQVEVTGPDAFRFVCRLTPRNLVSWQVGQCLYLALTNDAGGVFNDPVGLRLGENHFWLSVADRDVLSWARALAIGFGMRVDVREPDVSPLAIQGPKSFDVAAELFGDWVRTLGYFRFRETELEGIPLVLARSGWSKQGGYELFLRDGSQGDRLWEMVMEAGRTHDIRPSTPSSIERVESGLLNYWEDITDRTNPLEVGLGRFVDLTQETDFIGKAALQRIAAEGVRRRLVGLEIQAEPLYRLARPWPVLQDGRPVGAITSAVYSPDLERNIAMAMVDIEAAGAGTRLAVDLDDAVVAATVVEMPFIDNTAKVWRGLRANA
jgi:aminomethyltransferase